MCLHTVWNVPRFKCGGVAGAMVMRYQKKNVDYTQFGSPARIFALISVWRNVSHISRDVRYNRSVRALCRTKLLPVTHVLVDTWILTVKPVYKL